MGVPVGGEPGRRPGSAVRTRGAATGAGGALETWLPDNALTLPEAAATHGVQSAAVRWLPGARRPCPPAGPPVR